MSKLAGIEVKDLANLMVKLVETDWEEMKDLVNLMVKSVGMNWKR